MSVTDSPRVSRGVGRRGGESISARRLSGRHANRTVNAHIVPDRRGRHRLAVMQTRIPLGTLDPQWEFAACLFFSAAFNRWHDVGEL